MYRLLGFVFFIAFFWACQPTHYSPKPVSFEDNIVDWSIAGLSTEVSGYDLIINVQDSGAVPDMVSNNSTIIQKLIDKADAGTILFFPNGVYLFKDSLILKDSIILRGNCPENTQLVFDLAQDSVPSLIIQGHNKKNDFSMLDGSHNRGVMKILTNEEPDLKIGEYIEIIQDNDPSKMYTRSSWNTEWAQQSVGQMGQVAAAQGPEILLASPLLTDLDQDLKPRYRKIDVIQGVGIENLQLRRLDSGHDYNIRFAFAVNCWIKNIEAAYCDRGHVQITQSLHIEVRDSYFHHAHDYGEGGHGYGVNLEDHTTSCLIENNIFHSLRHAFLAKEGSLGNVFAYNYSFEPLGSPNDIAMHGHYGQYNLLEGNVVQKIIAGDYWGPSGPGNTYFRNLVEADSIVMQDHTHLQNILGNRILNGEVVIRNSQYTNLAGNFSASDSVQNQSRLVSSLYLKNKPVFFGDQAWPPVDPYKADVQVTIPAVTRWKSGFTVFCQPKSND